eukprot:scaffold218701_cov14-Prasinocladus_malaysianus.AAC.2
MRLVAAEVTLLGNCRDKEYGYWIAPSHRRASRDSASGPSCGAPLRSKAPRCEEPVGWPSPTSL